MKKTIAGLATAALFLLSSIPALAAKPTNNLAAAKKILWNLSGEVMPNPPYGTVDIIGSDTASKLIVNQPNGRTETAMSGIMKGLHPDTIYTVYLSKGYTPYTPLSILGSWKWIVLNTYIHDVTITEQNSDGTFSGTAGYPTGGEPWTDSNETTEVITGQIDGNNVSIHTEYNGPYNPSYSVTASGVIQSNGSIIGTVPWAWSTSEGAVKLASGSTGWPGLFTDTIQPFTFTTDAMGEATWHINMRDENFSAIPSVNPISVWINEGGKTILISDTFEVSVD